jgi:tyrosyl-tRNA synthetase
MFGGDIKGLDDATIEDVFSEVPSYELPRAELAKGRLLSDVLVQCGIFKSKGEVRRSIEGGGLYLNNGRIDALDVKLTHQSLCSAHAAVIRKGKKDYHLIRFTGA